MPEEKYLTPEEAIEENKSVIEKLEPADLAKATPAQGTVHTMYVADGWGLQLSGGNYYWHPDCSNNLVWIKQSQLQMSAKCGSCPQGPQYRIWYHD
jgi:hypothetical protein